MSDPNLYDAHMITGRDSVATVVRPVSKGSFVRAKGPDAEMSVRAEDDIPAGHKIALADVLPGEKVLKYGEVIGVATRKIRRGEHVHLHNLDGVRARGDLR